VTVGDFQFDRSKVFPTLERAPIVEAVLQWKAEASVEFEEEKLRKELKDRFSDYEIRRQQNIEAALRGSPAGTEFKHSSSWEGFRLIKQKDEVDHFVCQFKQNGLIFSQLAPYTGWKDFESEAKRFWDVFGEIGRPIEIAQLSTRYISQIPITKVDEISDYIDVDNHPLWVEGVSSTSFFHQDRMSLDDFPYTINLVRAVQPKKESRSKGDRVLIVDIDVAMTDSISHFDQMSDQLAALRFLKNEVFFSVIKDAATKFGGGKT
jgi:uncharacterized protein (TIGR04255 family)